MKTISLAEAATIMAGAPKVLIIRRAGGGLGDIPVVVTGGEWEKQFLAVGKNFVDLRGVTREDKMEIGFVVDAPGRNFFCLAGPWTEQPTPEERELPAAILLSGDINPTESDRVLVDRIADYIFADDPVARTNGWQRPVIAEWIARHVSQQVQEENRSLWAQVAAKDKTEAELRKRLLRAQEEREEALSDAERYRYLRDHHKTEVIRILVDLDADPMVTNTDIDRAVDAEIMAVMRQAWLDKARGQKP